MYTSQIHYFSLKPELYAKNISTFLLSTCMALAATCVYADENSAPAKIKEESSAAETIWEFDPYYSDVELYVPLTSSPIPTITSDNEFEIYRKLIEGSAIPRYMLLEASVYPMPILGTYLKSQTPEFYNGWDVGNGGSNILESATAGFQEPWAVSAFFGNIAKLVRPGTSDTELKGNNLGYSGYLISAGSKHIKDNMLYSDNWYELEWKIKGKRDYPHDRQTWSFRVGAKFNDNPDITNTSYLSIYRSNLNSKYSFLNWLKNTDSELKIHFSQHDGQMIRLEMILGKKYPIANKNYTPTLGLGFVWSSPKEYSGAMASRTEDSITLVLRPSIEF